MIMLELQNNNAQFKDLFLSVFLVVQIQTRCRFVICIKFRAIAICVVLYACLLAVSV
jgi:hypothetical protein